MIVAIVLVVLAFLSILSAGIIGLFILLGSSAAETGNVAVIEIKGPIMSNEASGVFTGDVASATDIIKLIEEADQDSAIQAILFEINSPGGTAVASYEIAKAIEEVNKTTVAWIREIGTSGAYWVATATDQIIASPLSATGSIGVIASYLDFSGFIERYNISYQRLVAGDQKDVGTPFRELSNAEEAYLQGELDIMHDVFIRTVAENRGLSEEYIRDLATGRFFVGLEALDLGLVDQLGSKAEAVAYIENVTGIDAELATFESPTTLADIFGGVLSRQSFFVGKGIGDSLSKTRIANTFEIIT